MTALLKRFSLTVVLAFNDVKTLTEKEKKGEKIIQMRQK